MAGRSSQADNRGSDFFGLLVSGKGKDFHSFRKAPRNIPPFEATGGTKVTPGNGYHYHFFTSSGSLVCTGNPTNSFDYIVIAGGGAGGGRQSNRSSGGGGGAGGYREATGVSVDIGTYPVVVGAGGGAFPAVSPPSPAADFAGADGSPSTLSLSTPVVAAGGGGGGGFSMAGRNGGSGGGGGETPAPNGTMAGGSGNTPPVSPSQGNSGGSGGNYPGGCGAGGGGAGAAGSSISPNSANGDGGVGKAAFSGDTGIPPSYGTPGPSTGRWFAGGGGGMAYDVDTTGRYGTGGAGGGASAGNDATANTGGGGAAQNGGNNPPFVNSAGSGIVIVRYPITG